MTQPRCLVAGMTVLVTRRTLRRTQLLRPDPELRRLYVFGLATLAKRHRIRVHAVTLMSERGSGASASARFDTRAARTTGAGEHIEQSGGEESLF